MARAIWKQLCKHNLKRKLTLARGVCVQEATKVVRQMGVMKEGSRDLGWT